MQEPSLTFLTNLPYHNCFSRENSKPITFWKSWRISFAIDLHTSVTYGIRNALNRCTKLLSTLFKLCVSQSKKHQRKMLLRLSIHSITSVTASHGFDSRRCHSREYHAPPVTLRRPAFAGCGAGCAHPAWEAGSRCLTSVHVATASPPLLRARKHKKRSHHVASTRNHSRAQEALRQGSRLSCHAAE